MDFNSIDIGGFIKEGGGMALAAVVIAYTAWKDKMYNRTLNNHLNHLNETMHTYSSNQDKMITATERQNQILERVERILDQR